MNRHRLNIGLENFRVFREITEFEFAPITILTGANSSGKSSIIKGIMIMEEFLKNQKSDHFYFKNPEIDFKDKLKILGSFDCIINEPDKEYISFKIHNRYECFGDYYVLFKFSKEGKIKGKLTHLSIYFENAKETVYSFDYKPDSKEEYRRGWFSKINYYWLSLQIKKITSDIRESERLDEIYKAHLDKFEKEYGREMSCFEAGFFIPEITSEFAIFLKENEFDVDEFIELREKLFFLKKIKCNIQTKKGSRDYYAYLVEKNVNFDNGFFVYKSILDILYSLGNDYNAYTFYGKMLEIYPELEEVKDQLLKDCELVFIDGIITIDDCKNIDANYLNTISKMEIHTGTDDFDPDIKIPETEIYNGFISQISDPEYLGVCNIFKKYWMYLNTTLYMDNSSVFLGFVNELLSQEFLTQITDFFSNITYIEANRAEMKRSYEFDGKKNSFNLFVRDFVEEEYKYKYFPVRREDKLEIVNYWLKELEIADKMEIDINEDGSKINLIKGNVKRNIADLGYGTTQLLPLLMYVAQFAVNNGVRLNSRFIPGEEKGRPSKVGCAIEEYGDTDKSPYTICIEEPETNLHPKIQAKLADFFVFCATELNIRFIIETHSETLIRKLQYLTAKGDISHNDSIIYYIGNPDSIKKAPNEEQIRRIHIKPNGQLSQPFGSGFTDESTKWIKEMFVYSNNN